MILYAIVQRATRWSCVPCRFVLHTAAILSVALILGPWTLAKGESISESDTARAVDFGRGFTAVCKVGKRGGDGTLIRPAWVLTAAHVARGMYGRTAGNLFVYCGDEEVRVRRVFVHPKAGPMSKHDIGLLQLERPVESQVPIPIYTKADELGQEIVLAGHGDKRDAQNAWIKDGKLRAYTNQIDEVSDLRIVFDYDGPDGNPTSREGTSGPGDSGGPALIKLSGVQDGDHGYRVAGISSMGNPGRQGPATYGAIEHFVRVSSFKDWIDQTIRNPKPEWALSAEDAQPQRRQARGPGGESRSGAVVSSAPLPAPGSGRGSLSDSDQAATVRVFLEALREYSDRGMEAAIKRTFAAPILERRSPAQVMANTPALYRRLRGATLKGVVSESAEAIEVELINTDTSYILKLFFDERQPDKLSQLMFGRLSG